MQIFLCSHKNSRKMKHRLEWPTNQDKLLDGHYISVSWTGMKLGPNMYFVNKQLTDIRKKLRPFGFLKQIFNRLGQTNILRKFHQNPEQRIWENDISLFQWTIY